MRYRVEVGYELKARTPDEAFELATAHAVLLGGEDGEVIEVEPILDEEEEGE